MDETFYIGYFQDLATRLADIAHVEGAERKAFFVIDDVDDIREVQESIRKQLANRAMLLEVFEDDLTDKGSDNNLEILSGAFAIVERVSSKSVVTIREARQNCRGIAKKIIFKTRRDSVEGILAGMNIICKIESKGFPVGPVADSCYGWRYTFTWQVPMNTAEDPADWLS